MDACFCGFPTVDGVCLECWGDAASDDDDDDDGRPEPPPATPSLSGQSADVIGTIVSLCSFPDQLRMARVSASFRRAVRRDPVFSDKRRWLSGIEQNPRWFPEIIDRDWIDVLPVIARGGRRIQNLPRGGFDNGDVKTTIMLQLMAISDELDGTPSRHYLGGPPPRRSGSFSDLLYDARLRRGVVYYTLPGDVDNIFTAWYLEISRSVPFSETTVWRGGWGLFQRGNFIL